MFKKVIIFTLFLGVGVLFADEGGLPGMFLEDGAGARSIALGKSFVGLANDGEATYYNPAGLTQLVTNDLTFMAATLYGGAKQAFMCYALPTKYFGSFGFSYSGAYVSVDTGDLEPGREFISAGYHGVLLSYAKDILPAFSVGLTYKIAYCPIGDYSTGVGHGFDLGIHLFPQRTVSFGAVGKNLLQPRIKYEGAAEEAVFPRIFRFGAAVKFLENNLIFLSDLHLIPSKDTADKSILYYKFFEGIEYHPTSSAAVRLGLNSNEFTAGFGLTFPMPKVKLVTMHVDYAFLLHYHSRFLLGPTQKLSLSLRFGGFKTWVEARPSVFNPAEKITWFYVHIGAKGEITRWQFLIKNSLGEVVRSFGGFGEIPLTQSWDGRNEYGQIVPDGKYFYELILTEDHTPRRYTGPLVTVKSKI